MMTDSIGPKSSLDVQSRQFSDERATMAGETELTVDIYGGSLPSPSPRNDAAITAADRSAANGVDSTRIINGAALTGSGSRKNGFLPNGMSKSSDRSDKYGKKQPFSKKMTPVWRRIISRPSPAVISDHQVAYNNAETTANGVKTSYNFHATNNSHMPPTADSQNGASLNGQKLVRVGEMTTDVQRSSLTETRSGSEHEQQHLNIILGAPAGFRDGSFKENDETQKITADGNFRLQGVSANADRSLTSSFTDVKKRPAPPVPLKPSLPLPQLTANDSSSQKRPAPEVPLSSRTDQSVTTTLPDTLQSSSTKYQMEIGDKPAADIGKVVIPDVFQQSSDQSNLRSSSGPEYGSVTSILRRSSFIQHLETVVGRNTPTSSAVSTATRGVKRSGADGSMHNLSEFRELNQSSGSLVSQLFHSALGDHDDGGGKKFKFPVPGIDVPAESDEQQASDDDDGTVPSPRVRRGFSYLTDVKVAAEVTRRAASMTAKRQHESVEESMRDRVDVQAEVDREETALRAARARLHAPQPHIDFPAVAPSSADSGGRKQMLLDIVDAARRRARKNGMDSADDDYLEEEDNNQNYLHDRTRNLLHDGYDDGVKRQQKSTRESHASSTFESGGLRHVTESKDVVTLDNRPEVPDEVFRTFAEFDNDQKAAPHELKAPDFYRGPITANFPSASANRRVEGVTSYRAARQAHRSDIDRQLSADRLAADDVANAASARHSSYLSYMSSAAVAGKHADAGRETRHGPLPDDIPRRRQSVSTSSSDDEPDSWWISDGEEGDGGGYTVSIVGGQVRAQRLHRQRSAARNHRRRTSLRRRPHVRQRPISVEVWSSDDEGESRWKGNPHRRHFPADRRPSPLTVDTGNVAARPHSVIGHIRNPGITQSTEIVQRRVTNPENLHYFSDPETKLGPYRTGAYVSQSDANFNSLPSFNIVAPELNVIRSGRQTSVPQHTVYVPAGQPRMETMSAVDPQLADVGTKNRRYFVQMLLNATRGGGEVMGVGSNSNSGGSNGGGMITRGWYGSAPQLLQLTDDVTDQYAGARYNALGENSFTTMQPSVRHRTVYDVTSPDDDGAFHVARRPWTGGAAATTGHVLRSVTSSQSPAAAVGVVTAERRRPVGAVNGDVNRSTVEFDIELEPVADRTRHVEMDEGRRSRLLASVHSNGLAGHRSTSPPRYAIQLNDTMRFDIDSPNDSRDRLQPAPNPPTYDHVRHQRQQRRRRPLEHADDLVTEQQRTVVDLRPPPRPFRRRRQIPVVYDYNDDDDDDDARLLPKSNHVNVDDEVFNETRRSATTTASTGGQPLTHDSNDLPHVVRGSILIRNSIDTAGTPRHIDVVTTADSDAAADALVVEDNTNMFDGLYRQSRENPIYLSDPELSPDGVDGSAVNSAVHKSTRSQQNRHRKGYTKNKKTIVDDFDKNVNISRST